MAGGGKMFATGHLPPPLPWECTIRPRSPSPNSTLSYQAVHLTPRLPSLPPMGTSIPPRHERANHHPVAECEGDPGFHRLTHHNGRQHDAPDRGRDNRSARVVTTVVNLITYYHDADMTTEYTALPA